MIFIFVVGAIGAAFHGDFSGIEAIFSFLGVVLVLIFGFWLIYKIGLLGASIVLNIMWIRIIKTIRTVVAMILMSGNVISNREGGTDIC